MSVNRAVETMRDHIVTCHIHDSSGCGDRHRMPFDGSIDREELMPKLRSCPRMDEFQTEVRFDEGADRAGKPPSPPGGYSIRRLTETFTRLGF